MTKMEEAKDRGLREPCFALLTRDLSGNRGRLEKGSVVYLKKLDLEDKDALCFQVVLPDGNFYEIEDGRFANHCWIPWRYLVMIDAKEPVPEFGEVSDRNFSAVAGFYASVCHDEHMDMLRDDDTMPQRNAPELCAQCRDTKKYDGGKILDITRSWFEGKGK